MAAVAAVSASQGAMRPLVRKLDSLLRPPEQRPLRKGDRKKILLLRDDLHSLLDGYLVVEPPDTATTAACWAKEVRELSYDVDDFVDKLTTQLRCGGDGSRSSAAAAAKKTGMVARLRGELNRRRWIADEIARFRARVKEAIRRYESYNRGGRCGSRPREEDDERGRRFLSLTLGMDNMHVQIAGRDSLMKSLVQWLAGDDKATPALKVGSILGPGGVGKTTVATEVYRLHGRRLECRAFVRTSRKPDVAKILADMLSQLRPQHQHQCSDVWEVDQLVETIRAHLQDKKYFIIIEDLWASSTWDIISRGLPENNCCSRILMTTEIKSVALACSGYNSEHIFEIDPLKDDVPRELFFSRVVGEGNEFPGQHAEVSYDIIKKCGGLPLAITITARHFKSQLLDSLQQWDHIQNSLTTANLKKNPTLQGMRQVLNLIYNKLPNCLKACMLYLSIYREDYIIRKDDLVKQWMAEGFIDSTENEDMEEVGGNYFDELVSRGLIQPVDINCKNEVLSCVVHHMVLNFIRCKSIEENFCITLEHSQTAARYADKVRRLSLHFGSAQVDATTLLTGLRLSQVRSMAFFGQVKCVPSIAEYRLLRVLNLQFWAHQEKTSCDLTSISELLQLRYLKIITGNITAKLPEMMQGLQYLQTLEVDARTAAASFETVQTERLLHLRLVLLERLPDSRYVFTSIPSWIGKLDRLRVLNIAVMQISQDDLDTLRGLPALSALSLRVQTAPAQRIVVANEGFWALSYFMFACTAPCMAFVEGAMPRLERFSVRFNADEFKQYGPAEPGFEHLASLQEISARIEGPDADADQSDKEEVESALKTAIRRHPRNLVVNIRWVDWIFGVEERDSDEDDSGVCMLSKSSSHQRNRDSKEWEDRNFKMTLKEAGDMQAGSSRQRVEEETAFGVEGMVTECHTMDEFWYLMDQAMESRKLVVIEFSASWCVPSRMIAPVFAEYAKEFAGAVFLKVDIDDLEAIAESYDIDGVVPTFAFVKDGQKIDMIQGAKSLRAKIQMHTASPHFLTS
ncbi:disease resistance protein RGA5-like [Oryza brachyantha]|uniref:disease resistance protein RGA5-like n=1 Tax=Oryza brachyantha TaxID=4533 RepID=UPI001ADCF431|nr:disease resistance protein RGA5-like [Oryza brachyantha]